MEEIFIDRGLEGKGKRSLLILTSKGMVEEVVQNILNNNYERFHIIGVSLMDADWAGHSTFEVDRDGKAKGTDTACGTFGKLYGSYQLH